MSRVRAAFDRGKCLVVYLTQGDPSPEASADIVVAAAEAGADVIELGVPFSDPNADGVVIQQAMLRALKAGGGLGSALDTVREVRRRGCDVPLVLFGYYNPIFVYGVDAFARDAAAAGVDACLVVDLPIDEVKELHGPLAAAGVGVIPLVAPTSDQARIDRARELDPPFVYYISMTGITGAALRDQDELPARVADVRERTGAPVAVGFGIKTGADVARVAAYADGAVVGTAVVQRIEAADDPAADVADFVRELRAGLR